MLRTGGVIKRCFVQAGDSVRQGDPILELEDATQRAEVEVALTNLDLARAEAEHVNAGINPFRISAVEKAVGRLKERLRYLRSEANRTRTLLARSTASQQEYEAIDTQRMQCELELKEQEAELLHLRNHVTAEHKAMMGAKVRYAGAALALAEERLRETRLLAPFDGTILKLLKREGEGGRAFEPEPVVLFGDTTTLRIRAEVDERFVQHLAVGQPAVIHGRNLGDKSYRGRIAALEPVMGDKTVYTRASSERKDLDVMQVLIELEPDFRAPTGLQVDVKIIVSGPAR
jgi:HlyD family secretion protein